MRSNIAYWLYASLLPQVGPLTFLRWLKQFKSIKDLFTANSDSWRSAGIPAKYDSLLKSPSFEAVEKDLAWALETSHYIITLEDPLYPARLKEISDPPLVLYAKGNVNALQQIQLAVIGSRHASVAGLKNAEYFAYHLAKLGLVITSGLARGIDAAAHCGAIKANGMTVAVTGSGLQNLYPKEHIKLGDEIVERDGLLLSEFPLHAPPHASNFPRRNRIISGMSVGVLVIEAALKSGSLITARHALEQGREVFAIPGSIHLPQARGCHFLIQQGAKLVTSVNDVLDELGSIFQPTASFPVAEPADPLKALSELEKIIINQIEYEITPIDVIISRSGLTASEVSSILLTLELSGYVQSTAGGYFRFKQVEQK